jgi:hypothetical protein
MTTKQIFGGVLAAALGISVYALYRNQEKFLYMPGTPYNLL